MPFRALLLQRMPESGLEKRGFSQTGVFHLEAPAFRHPSPESFPSGPPHPPQTAHSPKSLRNFCLSLPSRTYDDLESHSKELSQQPATMEYAALLHRMLIHYLSFTDLHTPTYWEASISLTDVVAMLGRIRCNAYMITDEDMDVVGQGVYLQSSRFDHSCQPNASQIFFGKKLSIRANQKISSVTDVRIAYIPRMFPARQRQAVLKETFFFDCDCPRCSRPEKDAEEFGLRCLNVNCKQSIPSDERADDPCPTCGTAPPDHVNRLQQYDRLVETVITLLEKGADADPDVENWKLLQRCSSLMHDGNPILTALTVFCFRGAPDEYLSRAEMLRTAISFARKFLPVVDPLRSFILFTAVVVFTRATCQPDCKMTRSETERLLKDAYETLAVTYGTNSAHCKDVKLALTKFLCL
ncbi:LOW QUALITY PROTEIN: uncharacterized protein LOC129602371 [Paramacrobiotus metropolitanus]|uniref:LOW QUALITY PROTEIN: uncharacterized protein LOC129602371 n=1 Tax=Paramacrobiotus metropolitanus TaxID=2943436 RepID=UPI0024458D69|nr:LOW QUALITY PROTEIN: uncharacterized protein LOC129602371 [Paramacrobiotus metropolitanus]